jgi:hypothetical protein
MAIPGDSDLGRAVSFIESLTSSEQKRLRTELSDH